MNLNKSTRYALYAAMEMALAGPDSTITVGEVAGRYGISEGALAKVLQQMVRGGLAIGTRGVGGGYRLSRDPSEFTVLDVLNAFEPSRSPGHCLLDESDDDCNNYPRCRLGRLFDEVDEMTRNTFASISLETLVK